MSKRKAPSSPVSAGPELKGIEFASCADDTTTTTTVATDRASKRVFATTATPIAKTSTFAARIAQVSARSAQRAAAKPVLLKDGQGLCLSTHVNLIRFLDDDAAVPAAADEIHVLTPDGKTPAVVSAGTQKATPPPPDTATISAAVKRFMVCSRFMSKTGVLDIVDRAIEHHAKTLTARQRKVGSSHVRGYLALQLALIKATTEPYGQDNTMLCPYLLGIPLFETAVIKWVIAITFLHASTRNECDSVGVPTSLDTLTDRLTMTAKRHLAVRWLVELGCPSDEFNTPRLQYGDLPTPVDDNLWKAASYDAVVRISTSIGVVARAILVADASGYVTSADGKSRIGICKPDPVPITDAPVKPLNVYVWDAISSAISSAVK